jgi:tetratricopeptide (TPR) repeat protein
MKIRLVVSFVVVLLLSHSVRGQQTSQESVEIGKTVRASANSQAYRQDLGHRIALEENSVRQAEVAHADDVDVSRMCVQLGLLYQDAAQWDKSEAVLEHAASLLRHSAPSGDLAATLSQLGILHVLMGKLRESEKEDLEALKLRQNLGDRLEIARSWNDLAVLYLSKQNFVKARDFSQLALSEFANNKQVGSIDRMSARFALSEALCSIKECPSAIPLLHAALDEAKAMVEQNNFPIGLATFLLGYAYWKSGNMTGADEYLKRGTGLMNEQLGWGHPAYLKALKCYAQFLRENQRAEAANVVERRIRQVEAVVDVHSIQTAQGMFGFAGLR